MEAVASSVLTVKPSQADSTIRKVLKSKRPPMLHGSPAIGKSSIIHRIAEHANLELIDLRMSQCEPPDLLGFPYVDQVRGKSGYLPMDTFPLEGDDIPEGRNGWLLFLDELTSAEPPVQAAGYKLILDRKVGKQKLHPNCYIAAAGNLETDNAVVHQMSTALKSRMTHIVLRLDVQEWLSWAMDNNFDHRITDYIQFKKDDLYKFDPDSDDMTYAAPRTWHANNDLLVMGCDGNIDDPDFLVGSAGNVGHGVTREFLAFCKVYQSLPTIASIIAAPEAAAIPPEPGTMFALAGLIGRGCNKDNITQLMKYIGRMSVEYQVVTMRYAIKKDRNLRSVPVVVEWLAQNISKLF